MPVVVRHRALEPAAHWMAIAAGFFFAESCPGCGYPCNVESPATTIAESVDFFATICANPDLSFMSCSMANELIEPAGNRLNGQDADFAAGLRKRRQCPVE